MAKGPSEGSAGIVTLTRRGGLASYPFAVARLVRPKQWTKNGLLLLPFLFTLNINWDFGDPTGAFGLLGWAALGAGVYCILSGATYIVNDIIDVERDRAHPTKRNRPVAAGDIGVSTGAVTAAALLVIGVGGAFLMSAPMGLVATGYVGLTLAYSLLLKNLMIVDVIAVAAAYVMRVLAGAVAIDVPISPWLYLCTILGALFIAIIKRRAEAELMQEDASSHRDTLSEYTPGLLNQMMAVVAPSTVMAYALYTFTASNLPDEMMLTIPFVIYGLFRYTYLADARRMGGAPERVLLEDKPMLVTVIAWLAAVLAILWLFPRP